MLDTARRSSSSSNSSPASSSKIKSLQDLPGVLSKPEEAPALDAKLTLDAIEL